MIGHSANDAPVQTEEMQHDIRRHINIGDILAVTTYARPCDTTIGKFEGLETRNETLCVRLLTTDPLASHILVPLENISIIKTPGFSRDYRPHGNQGGSPGVISLLPKAYK